MIPLVVELYCGTFGWSQGWLKRGGRAVGFDIEHHPWHGPVPQGAELILQDVRTVHGSQLKEAFLILASPPCQEFSYRAMPWKRAKALPPPVLGMELFNACFRIQKEASDAAGRHIPMVVENVCGAQKWVGRARWHFGSYYLWGDVPALMPITLKGYKSSGLNWSNRDLKGQDFTRKAAEHARGVKGFTPNGQPLGKNQLGRKHGSKSNARRAASALIARIPERLSDWIAECYFPMVAANDLNKSG